MTSTGNGGDIRQQLQDWVLARKGTRKRQSGSEQWLDFHCPLHGDRHRSASFQPDTGSLICRVCGSLEPDLIIATNPPPSPRSASLRTAQVALVTQQFPYVWPDGTLSHYKVRLDMTDGGKRFHQTDPQGNYSLPAQIWPLYGDYGLPRACHLVYVEGERKADCVNVQDFSIGDSPVRAVTAGSAADLKQRVERVLVRLKELAPASLLLWPDNDPPGLKAMHAVYRIFEQSGLACVMLDPDRYQMGHKEDVQDFLEDGGDLPYVIHQEQARQAPKLVSPRDVADLVPVLGSGLAVLPKTNMSIRLDLSWCKTLWYDVTGQMASERQATELLNLLRLKSVRDAIPEHWRIMAGPDHVWWRPGPKSQVYRISKDGIDLEPDVPGAVLLVSGESRWPEQINLDGEDQALTQVLKSFGLGEHERDMIEAWLVAALTGQQAPILLIRGDAGSGKTTLARFLVSLIDPCQPEIDGSARVMDDQRQLIRNLQRSPIVAMDNVTSLPAAVEDLLCKLVTGYQVGLRVLYGDSSDSIWLRRAIVMTTTSWEAYRGDLSTRIMVAEVRRQTDDGYGDDEEMGAWMRSLMPAARGWIMKRAAEHYAKRVSVPNSKWPFRIASLGRILHSLGRDVAVMAQDEADHKAALLNANDTWLQAVVAVWRKHNDGGEGFLLSTANLVDLMYEEGVPVSELPDARSKRFPNWLADKAMIFQDYGFRLERSRTSMARGYWFRPLHPFRVLDGTAR